MVMLVNEMLRDKDTVLAQGYTEIVPLTLCYYEHLRSAARLPYFKEIPYLLRAYPKLVRENYVYFFSHRREWFKMGLSPVKQLRFFKNNLVRLTYRRREIDVETIYPA